MGIKRDEQGKNRQSEGTSDGGKFAPELLGEVISKRGNLADVGRAAEDLAEMINGYDRTEAKLNLTGQRKGVAYKAYLDAAADHDRNSLRAIGDWAGAEHQDAKSISIGRDGKSLWLQKSEGNPIQVPEKLTSQLSENFAGVLGSDEEIFPVEVLRNIDWITDEEIIEVDLGDTIPLDEHTDEIFHNVDLTRDADGSLALTYSARLDLPGILSQQGHRLDGLSAAEFAYEHENVLTKAIRERYGLEITNPGDESAEIGGYVSDESWSEASAEQVAGLLYSSELVRFHNESDNGTSGAENLSRILVEAVEASRTTRAAA
jgi:hypothetical protein